MNVIEQTQFSLEKFQMGIIQQPEWLSRDNLSSLQLALVTYRHEKNLFTHL